MAKDRDDELNQGTPDAGEEQEFTLEEILEEFREKPAPKPRVTGDTIPFPIIPKSARTAPPRGKPGRVVNFPKADRKSVV